MTTKALQKVLNYILIFTASSFVFSCKKTDFENSSTTLPIVKTDASATQITANTAWIGIEITSTGASPLIACGICWSTSPQPTILDSKTNQGGQGANVWVNNQLLNLEPYTQYYARAYAINSSDTAYGNIVSFTTLPLALTIGQQYQGGIVAYILQPNDSGYDPNTMHGFIAQPSDFRTLVRWGCNGILVGSSGTAIGTGFNNSYLILHSSCFDMGYGMCCIFPFYPPYPSQYSRGDWYLPSLDELNKMYLNKNIIGGFTTNTTIASTANYLSSTEIDANTVCHLNFEYGYVFNFSKQNAANIRLIRNF